MCACVRVCVCACVFSAGDVHNTSGQALPPPLAVLIQKLHAAVKSQVRTLTRRSGPGVVLMFFFMFFLFFMFLIFFLFFVFIVFFFMFFLFFVFIVLFVMFFSFFLFFMLLFFIVLFFVFFTLQEDLPVHLNDIGGMSEGLKMLAQPFKLKLQRADGETALRDYSQNVVRPCQSRTLPVADPASRGSKEMPFTAAA